MKHWQDPVTALLGAWLILSPWILGFSGDFPATANFMIVGALLAAAAVGAMWVPKAWEEWVQLALALWLVASPWILGFAGTQVAAPNAIFCGLAAALLSAWVLGTDDDYGGWLHRLVG
jgi:hypothetical protein